jgi:hypothetical protein
VIIPPGFALGDEKTMKAYIHNFFLAGCLLYGPAIVSGPGWMEIG